MSRSIRELIERENNPIPEMFHVYDNLVKEAVNCRVPETSGELLRQGEMMSIDIENLTVPRIDFFTGEIEHMPVDFEQYPVYVSFNGANGPEEAKIDVETSTSERLNVVVPDLAASGKINLLIPAIERFNPEKLFFRYVRPENREGCMCSLDPQDITEENVRDIILSKLEESELQEELVYYPLYVDFANIVCNCSVTCPNNAIQYDSYGFCSIDPDKCKGQRYHREFKQVGGQSVGVTYKDSDGKTRYKRSAEVKCWKCFEPQNRCKMGRIWKVVYHKTKNCCGSCPEESRIQNKYFREFCVYGAISGGRPTSSSFFDDYTLDPDKCKGCMKCYYGITCQHNFSLNQYTTHQGAYIPKREAKLRLKSISYHQTIFDWNGPVQNAITRSYQLYLNTIFKEPTKYRLLVSGNKKETIEFTLDADGKHQFNDNIYFTRVAGLELFENETLNWGYIIFNDKGKNLGTKQILAVSATGATVDFETKKGYFRLEYDVKIYV